jgi:hypothetical protein
LKSGIEERILLILRNSSTLLTSSPTELLLFIFHFALQERREGISFNKHYLRVIDLVLPLGYINHNHVPPAGHKNVHRGLPHDKIKFFTTQLCLRAKEPWKAQK